MKWVFDNVKKWHLIFGRETFVYRNGGWMFSVVVVQVCIHFTSPDRSGLRAVARLQRLSASFKYFLFSLGLDTG